MHMYIHKDHDDNVPQDAAYWINRADLNWEPRMAPVLFRDDQGREHEARGHRVCYRSDNYRALNVPGDRFDPLRPIPQAENFISAVKEHGLMLRENAIQSAKNGARIVMRADLVGESFKIGKDDHRLFGEFRTSLDGSSCPTVSYSLWRKVCENGMHIPGSTEIIFKKKQTANLDPEDLYKAFRKLVSDIPETVAKVSRDLEELREIRMAQDEVRRWFATLVNDRTILDAEPVPVTVNNPDAPMFARVETPEGGRKVRQLMESYTDAPGACPGTAYGALQAVTHHVDHVSGRSEETRLVSSLWGAGDTLKTRAFESAMAMAA